MNKTAENFMNYIKKKGNELPEADIIYLERGIEKIQEY